MKKLLALLLACVMIVGLMAACNKGGEDTKPSEQPTQGGSAEQPTQGATDAPTEPTRENEERYGGHFNARMYNAMNGVDPLNHTGIWNYHWTELVYETALTRDADNNIQPGICNYEVSDDNLTLTMWMQDNVTFHDGTPCEITDVEASWLRASTMYNNIKTKVWPYVESMKVDGDKLIVKFTENREDIWYYMAGWQTWCAVQPKEICEKYTGDQNYNVDNIADAIGTGPYKLVALSMNVSLEVEKYEGYVPRGFGLTGYAGPKYGYLDSITFWTNQDDSNATMALLAGDYDIVECIDSEYLDLIEQEGIIETRWPSDTADWLYFNTASKNSLVSKYPSLRKAIAAAIDYEEFCKVITDNQQVMGGCFYLSPLYYTDEFVNQDYYGPVDQAVVDKYVAMAKQEGWNGTDPVQIYRNNTRDDIPTLFRQYLEDAGIPVEVHIMESGALSDLKAEKESSVWDVDMTISTLKMTPTTFTSWTYQSQPEYEALIEEMKGMDPASEEYIAKVKDLTKIHLEELGIAYMAMQSWFWYHPKEFHPNDEGLNRYYFNSYWDDPENHPKK